MDGLLIVDKPSGPTSHDVVSRARRALRETRIGHTGTLDPMASGVLPLVVGRATRLARFLGGDKAYDAVIRLGTNTDSYDAQGHLEGAPFCGPWPSPSDVEAALARFRGTFVQQPPAFSAKKIAGHRSYALARKARASNGDAADGTAGEASMQPSLPSPVSVATQALTLLEADGDLVRIHVRCSAGFYIRSLAFDLGAALGTGAHLEALRRTEAAGFGLEQALTFDRLIGDDGRDAAGAAILPMERMLESLPAVGLTAEGVSHVRHGRDIGPDDAAGGFPENGIESGHVRAGHVRLLDPEGRLVAVAGDSTTPGLLHPAVVLL